MKPLERATNYTNQQERLQAQVGLNLTHAWQLLYTARLQVVDVLPGTFAENSVHRDPLRPRPGAGHQQAGAQSPVHRLYTRTT